MIACWTVKGGSGVSVLAALLTRAIAGGETARLVDMAGDQPSLLGLDERPMPGFKQWAEAVEYAPASALEKILVNAGAGIQLVGSGAVGSAEVQPKLAGIAARRLVSSGLVDVVDVGCITPSSTLAAAVVAQAPESWLVIRPCYLALARAVASPLKPTRVILVEEPRRSLTHRDVSLALGVEVAAVLKWDPSLSRAVDSGCIDAYKGKNFSVIKELLKRTSLDSERIAPLELGAHLPNDAA